MRPVEDREKTLEEGGMKYKDVDFVIITPMGSKDRIERVASEWFEQNKIHVRDGRMPAEWERAFKHAYNEWKAGREVPLDGTELAMCSLFTPAQIKSMQEAGIRTVEDMAAANDSALDMIGMGGRALKQRAQSWLDAAEKQGKVAGKLEALQKQVEALSARAEKAENDRAVLEAQVKALEKEPVED
jgi:hypothetical protein